MGVRRFFYLGVIFLLGLTGCLQQSTGEPVPNTGPDTADLTPLIHSVEVLQSDRPQQVLVLVQAVLPNTCARLGEAVITREGQIFTVSLPGEPADGQNCQPATLNQDRAIRLSADPLAPGSYLVLVNGVLGSFTVASTAPSGPGLPTAVAGVVSPTATPAALPTEMPLPTATLPPQEPLFTPPTPTATLMALPAGEAAAECTNRAVLYGTLTIPDGTPLQPDASFTKTWLVMNTGSCTWGPGYQLVFAGGDPLGAPQQVPLPRARPRQIVQVSVAMTAPIAPFKYESYWAFETPDGYRFGLNNPGTLPLAAKISVVARPVGVPSELACGALRLSDMEQQVLEQLNSTRATYGLAPLELVEDISRVALKHSLEMACFDRDSHRGRDGMLYNVRLQRDGILFATSNEILYAGNGGPAGAIQWWMNSPVHKPIVLSDEYTQVGIAYVYYEGNPYKQRITVNFIHP